MSLDQNGILIAQYEGDDKWDISGPQGFLAAVAGAAPDERGSLSGFAERLAMRFGGVRVRIVVLVIDGAASEPAILAVYPRMICRMNRHQALAYSSDGRWQKFLVIEEGNEPRISSFVRTQAGVVQQPIDSSRLENVAVLSRALGIEQGILLTDDPGMEAPSKQNKYGVALEQVGRDSVIAGACAKASSLMKTDGVWSSGAGMVRISASRQLEYAVVHPERAVFDLRESALANVVGSRPIVIVSDLRVANLYAAQWRAYHSQHRLNVLGELLVPLCERSKAWEQVDRICGYALRCGLPRDGLLVGVGGGVALDIVGLAAALFRRGVGYVRIPTTLVSLADVAVGIKTGVNAHGKKNLIGGFHPPVASLNDYRFLHTLPSEEIACGMAEILKMTLIRDASLLAVLEKHGAELASSRFALPADIAREVCLRAELLMMEELAPNLFEKNRARLVDFGHTFSPAFEVWTEYRLRHGYAVALDMLLSTALAINRGIGDPSLLQRLLHLFSQLGLPVWHDCLSETALLMQAIEDTRRQRGGALNLVVCVKPGCAQFVQDVSLEQLESAVNLLQGCQAAQSAACSVNGNHVSAAV